MTTRFLFFAEGIELDYTDRFHAHITQESTEHGLRCEISLCDGEGNNEIVIGTIISKDYDMEATLQYAKNMLSNEEYCLDAWKDHCRRKRRRSNAAR